MVGDETWNLELARDQVIQTLQLGAPSYWFFQWFHQSTRLTRFTKDPESWRTRGGGPAFLRLRGKAIRYRLSDVQRFIDESVRVSTADPRLYTKRITSGGSNSITSALPNVETASSQLGGRK